MQLTQFHDSIRFPRIRKYYGQPNFHTKDEGFPYMYVYCCSNTREQDRKKRHNAADAQQLAGFCRHICRRISFFIVDNSTIFLV